MDTDFDIELLDEAQAQAPEAQLPLNFLAIGETEPDDVKVYIHQTVYKDLEKFALSNTEKELGSILLGTACQDLGKTHVVISHFLEAKYTDASAATLTFTHETWDHIHAEHQRLYPQEKIIGWQHTHPSYGIFLSNYDLFIQENFFDLPFQVAYVIDPVQNLRGFFQWKNGKIEKLRGFCIYDEVGKPIKIPQVRPKEAPGEPRKAPRLLTALLCAAVLGLGIFAFFLGTQLQDQRRQLEALRGQVARQETLLKTQADTVQDLEAQLDPFTQLTLPELIAMVENHELTLQNQEQVLSVLQGLSQEGRRAVLFTAYTVQPGDSLTVICQRQGIDYGANLQVIMAVNGIRDPNLLRVGQVLLLPVQE